MNNKCQHVIPQQLLCYSDRHSDQIVIYLHTISTLTDDHYTMNCTTLHPLVVSAHSATITRQSVTELYLSSLVTEAITKIDYLNHNKLIV